MPRRAARPARYHAAMPFDAIPDDVLLAKLRDAVGRTHVLTGDRATRRYRKGYRFGDGPVVAVVRPGTLLELWRVLQVIVAAGRIVLMQAANTGLTGGSTPDGDGYDRGIVLVSTRRLTGVQLLDGGRQVVCLPGATLDVLEKRLAPLGRDYFVLKPKHSGFFSTTLDLLLGHMGVRTVLLGGIATDICILFTANDAYMRGYHVIVPRDCVAANTRRKTDFTLAQIREVLKGETPTSRSLTRDALRRLRRADI